MNPYILKHTECSAILHLRLLLLHQSHTNLEWSLSLLPILSKLLECHVHSHLLQTYIQSPLWPPIWIPAMEIQSSRVLPLLFTTHSWHTILEQRSQVGCVFFDLSKAFGASLSPPEQASPPEWSFDSAPWLSNYLSGRLQRVVLNGISSYTKVICMQMTYCSSNPSTHPWIQSDVDSISNWISSNHLTIKCLLKCQREVKLHS